MEDLLKQVRKLIKRQNDTVDAWFDDDDLQSLYVRLKVDGGIHHGAEYTFLIKLNNDYLNSRPTVVCNSEIYHPNMGCDEVVCCNLLDDDWEDGTTLEGIVSILYGLIENPNFEDPLRGDVSEDGYADEVKRRLN